MDTPVRDVDIDELAARLRAEIAASTDPEAAAAGRPAWEPARVEAGRLAAITGDRPFNRRPGLAGTARYVVTAPAKFIVRKLVRWYVEPIAAEQRAFNGAVLRLVDDLAVWAAAGVDAERRRREEERAELDQAAERLAQQVAEADEALAQRATELDDRLLRVERRGAVPVQAATAATPAQPPPEVAFDYFAFEGRMRQSRDEIRKRQAPYVDDFRGREPVLDVGCGRGEFLELLRDAGIAARGVDTDADMVAFCAGEGLDVVQGDALSYLEALDDESLGGVFCAHVVEHMRPVVLLRFLDLLAAKIRAGGLVVLETPNPLTLVALQTFFADLTHERPLHPETLAFLVRQAGFRAVETRFLHPPPEEARLRPVPLPDDERFDAARAALAENEQKLNGVVFGPQDYAVVASR